MGNDLFVGQFQILALSIVGFDCEGETFKNRVKGAEEGEQRTEHAHEILPRRSSPQLFPLRIDQFPSDVMGLGLVPSEVLHSRGVGVIAEPWE